jgi:hypothetical protein
MYCQHCGQQSDDNLRFCGGCGRPFSGLSPSVSSDPVPQTLETNVRVMGILWAVYNGFRILMGASTLALSRYMLPFMKNFMSRDTTPFPSPQMFHVIFALRFYLRRCGGVPGRHRRRGSSEARTLGAHRGTDCRVRFLD